METYIENIYIDQFNIVNHFGEVQARIDLHKNESNGVDIAFVEKVTDELSEGEIIDIIHNSIISEYYIQNDTNIKVEFE